MGCAILGTESEEHKLNTFFVAGELVEPQNVQIVAPTSTPTPTGLESMNEGSRPKQKWPFGRGVQECSLGPQLLLEKLPCVKHLPAQLLVGLSPGQTLSVIRCGLSPLLSSCPLTVLCAL